MNAYADVTTFKSTEYANISSNTEQVRFRKLLENASRQLDKLTERFYYCWEGARYFDGCRILHYMDDLLSVTTIKLDEDGDGTYEETMAATDYVLYPLNKFPKTWAEISSNSDYGTFASGIKKGIEITGVFGHGDGWSATPYTLTGQTVQDNPLAAAATTLTVTSTADFGAGLTFRIEDEQCYCQSVTNATTCVIQRGVNGTTAAAHVQTTPIYVYEYPPDICWSALVIAMKAWKRKDSAFQDVSGSPETGLISVYRKGLDPDVDVIIERYRRRV